MANESAQIIDSSILDEIQNTEFTDQGNLREFKGKLNSWEAHQNQQYGTISAKLMFSGIEVIKSESPFDKDEFTIWIPVAKKKGSRFHFFMESVGQFIDSKSRLNDMVGKVVHMHQVEHSVYDGKLKKNVPSGVWEVAGIAGISEGGSAAKGEDPEMRAMELVVGKTSPEFKAIAMTDAAIGKDADLKGKIIRGEWQQAMIDKNYLLVDENKRYQLA